MARIRSVKPEFWTDRSLARKLSRDARMLYLGMWNLADEHGRLNGDAHYIKGQIFPYDDDLSAGAIDALLDALDDAGKVIRYADSGDPYLFLPRLGRHQRLEPEKVPSRLPSPPPHATSSAPHSFTSSTSSPLPHEENGEGNSEGVQSPTGPMNEHLNVANEVNADESARGADEEALFYVAGSMEQVAGSRVPSPDEGSEKTPPGFDEFWKRWPRKVDKDEAKAAFAKAVAKRRVDPAVIVKACAAYADRCELVGREKNFIPYPATWLNKQRWNDDLDDVMPLPAARSSPSTGAHVTFQQPADNSIYYNPKGTP